MIVTAAVQVAARLLYGNKSGKHFGMRSAVSEPNSALGDVCPERAPLSVVFFRGDRRNAKNDKQHQRSSGNRSIK